jgi:hypothetical protein
MYPIVPDTKQITAKTRNITLTGDESCPVLLSAIVEVINEIKKIEVINALGITIIQPIKTTIGDILFIFDGSIVFSLPQALQFIYVMVGM